MHRESKNPVYCFKPNLGHKTKQESTCEIAFSPFLSGVVRDLLPAPSLNLNPNDPPNTLTKARIFFSGCWKKALQLGHAVHLVRGQHSIMHPGET